MSEKKRAKAFPVEVRERAVRLVREHRGEHASGWAAIRSVAETIGCNPETLRSWLRQSQRDTGERAGMTTEMRERLEALERENRELRQGEEDQETVRWTVSPTTEILRKASAYFAQAELDRRPKT